MGKQDDSNLITSGIYKVLSTVGVQTVIVGLSFVTGLILPAKMGPEMYGYWQIFTLYFGYLNLFGLGYSDGMTLFYGGQEYKNLPFANIRGATLVAGLFISCISVILYMAAGLIPDIHQEFIFQLLALNIPLVCISCLVISIASSTNQTTLYNSLNLFQRVVTIGAYVILLCMSIVDYRSMILGDTIARIIFVCLCLYIGRKLFFGKRVNIRTGLSELVQKSSAGIHVTLAAIAAGIMPISGKLVIQFNAPVDVFGEYAFGMSLINIVTAFTSAAGLVIFPLLKRLKDKGLADYFQTLSLACNILLFAAMFAYLPCRWLIQHVIPEYMPVLEYLHVLLIICVPLGRLQLLLLPYFKALRLERNYFIANIIGVVVMIAVTWLSYSLTQQILAVALTSTLIYALWSVILEVYLTKKLGNQTHHCFDQSVNIIMMCAFVLCASSGGLVRFGISYGIVYCVYLALRWKDVKMLLKMLKAREG